VFSVICRLNFGKGLADYCELISNGEILGELITSVDYTLVHVNRVLTRTDFTPVCFSKKEEKNGENTDEKNASVHFPDLPPPAYKGPAPKPARASWIFSARNKSTVFHSAAVV
jgi:hypothetical protein